MIEIGKRDLLLVIDMQNVYRPGMDWSCESFDRSLNKIEGLIGKFPADNIAFTRFTAKENPSGIWKDYNKVNEKINNSEFLNDMAEELKPYITKDNLFVKSTYSSLKSNQILNLIDGFDRVFVAGVVAECCVLSTIFELIDYGKKVYYIKDSISGENSQKEKAVMLTLEGLSPLHVEFINADDILER